MKQVLIIVFSLLFLNAFSQTRRINPHEWCSHDHQTRTANANSVVADENIDVHFYEIDVEIALDSPYIEGSVSFLVESKIDNLQEIILDLDEAFTVDGVSEPAESFIFENSELTITLENAYNQGDLIEFEVSYHGVPVEAGGYKGLRYETHNGNEPIIASLSTPYLAHTWWPCKDGTSDKADSTFINITVQDTVISGVPVMAVSNGLLESVVDNGDTKTFNWRHRYPAVPFYIMVAISNYVEFTELYEGEGYEFPLDYYVFESHLENAEDGVAEMHDVMTYFNEIFGDYPFKEEKYGMTQLGYYGGIENQTNSIINNMGSSWFNVSVHELGHQWFADMITCETWNHGWLNEGFASYSEALYIEHADGFNNYQNYMVGYEFYNGGNLYLSDEDIADPFQGVFQSIIYNKGAYVLHMLRGVVGDEAFFEALLEYATYDQFMYKHATTEDLQMIYEEVSGMDLDYFFDQWIYDERYPKYSYNYSYNDITGILSLAIEQTQVEDGWREVFTMPIDVTVELAGGGEETFEVFNDQQTQSFFIQVGELVDDVELDPEKWILRTIDFDENVVVGIDEEVKEEFNVFPNPSRGSFTVELPFEGNGLQIKMKVLDMSGRTILTEWLSTQSKFSNVELTDLPEGIYQMRLEVGEQMFQTKLIIRE